MSSSTTLVIATFTLVLSGCFSDQPPQINGQWALDMNKTLQNAEEMGVSKQNMSRLMQTFAGAHLHITGEELVLFSKGVNGPSIKMPYSVVSSDMNCSEISIKADAEHISQKFCIVDGHLEVTGFLSDTREIYRRVL